MRDNNRLFNLFYLFLAFGLILSSSVVVIRSRLDLSPVMVTTPDGVTFEKSLPVREPSDGAGVYDLESDFQVDSFSQNTVRIIPDNCLDQLIVNGDVVPLRGFGRNERCDIERGVVVNLKPYLEPGTNTVRAVIEDNGGRYGVIIQPTLEDQIFAAAGGLFMIGIVILIVVIMRSVGFSLGGALLLTWAAILRIFYTGYTAFYVRSHDVDGHLEYVRYLLTHGRLPSTDLCWECWQPPVYYIISTISVSLARVFGFMNLPTVLQAQSVVMSFMTVVIGSLLIRKLFNKRLTVLGVALLAFWPSGIIQSARINNDLLVQLLVVVGLYLLIIWWRAGKERYLVGSMLTAALATLTKLNGGVLWGVIGVSVLTQLVMKRRRSNADDEDGLWLSFRGVFVGIVLLAATIFVAKSYVIRSESTGLIGNRGNLNSALFLDNELDNYTTFDIQTFIDTPFADSWQDESGRQYFWNHFLKTGLFGEFQFPLEVQKAVAVWMSRIALVIGYFALAGMLVMKEKVERAFMPLAVNLVLGIAAVMFLRFRVPASPSSDFRYAFPILVSVALFYSEAVGYLGWKQYTISNIFGYLIAAAWVVLSTVFFIAPLV